MDQELICELNLALVPDETLAKRHIALSQQVATQYPAVIQLNGVAPRLVFTPHLTLYQVPIPVRALPGLCGALADLTAKASKFSLTATEYRHNQSEASFEIRYDAAGDLMELQAEVIGAANPLRGDLLLERDPAGHRLSDLIDQPGTAGDNIRRTGFDAVGDPADGGLFHPHVTINWLRLGTSVNLDDPGWPPLSDFNGRFVALGIYLLGPYGTCAQRLAALDFAA
jgi:hypothetical protein